MRIVVLSFLVNVALCTPIESQEFDFFWSVNDLNAGAVNEPEVVFPGLVGETGSLFLYYSTSGPTGFDIDVGAFVDIATSRPGVIRFTHAETLEFPFQVGDFVVGSRWDNGEDCPLTFGKIGTVTDNFINELGAFTVLGLGIRAENADLILDTGYDAAADAFLFARIDYEVVGTGCTQIQIGRGQLGIVRETSGVEPGELFEPVFGSALINVGPFTLGDVDQNGELNLLDVGPFVQLLVDQAYSSEADVNCDDALDILDVAPFVSLLSDDFSFPVFDPSEEDTVPQFGTLGDATGDGFIDLVDVACFQNIGTDCGLFSTTDINGDNVIDLLDLCPFIELILEQTQE